MHGGSGWLGGAPGQIARARQWQGEAGAAPFLRQQQTLPLSMGGGRSSRMSSASSLGLTEQRVEQRA